MFRKLQGYYHTAIADLRYQGLEVLLWRIVLKLCSPVARLDLHILFDIDLIQPVRVLQARVPNRIERATLADIDEILDMQMPPLPPEQAAQLNDADELEHARMLRVRAKAKEAYRRQMVAGEHCFVARVDGVVAHSNWLRFHDCGPVDGVPVELLPGEVYSTDGFTLEALRGHRLHEAVATYMLDFARQRGCHIAYTITDLVKAGSRRGVMRIGWRRRGTVLYLTPRGLRRTWLFRLAGDLEPMFARARALSAANP